MRPLIFAAMAVLALPCGVARSDDLNQPEALFKSCPKGVLFKADESGVIVTVIRQGSGKACFSGDCTHLQAATAAELVTKDGKWRLAETASTTFYTVRTDDGGDVDFTLQDIGCTR